MLKDIATYVIKKILGILIFMLVFYGGGYLLIQNNPKMKEQADALMGLVKNLNQMAASSNGTNATAGAANAPPEGGIDLSAALKLLQQVQGSEVGKKVDVMPETVRTPESLKPFLNSLKTSSNYAMYAERLSVEKVGENGAGAIPILEKAAGGSSLILKEAAKKSLSLIGTEEANQALARIQ